MALQTGCLRRDTYSRGNLNRCRFPSAILAEIPDLLDHSLWRRVTGQLVPSLIAIFSSWPPAYHCVFDSPSPFPSATTKRRHKAILLAQRPLRSPTGTNDKSHCTRLGTPSPTESQPNSRNESQLKAKAVVQFDVCMRPSF